MEPSDDKDLFLKLNSGDERAFKMLFQKYYRPLCLFAGQIVRDQELAEETVQNFFVKIWEKRANLAIENSVKSYFFRSVKNHCINQIHHQKIRNKHALRVKESVSDEPDPDQFFMEVDLYERIKKSIGSMPPKRQEIFRLSREQGLKYKEIADALNISVKTVEAQMGLALKHLREELSDFRTYFTTLLFIFKNSQNKQ